MLRDDTLGSLLQGVSQQPEHVRKPGQVGEQINIYSDVTRGPRDRAGTDYLATLNNVPPEMRFDNITIDGQVYILGFTDGLLRCWDSTGQEQTVSFDSGTANYVGSNMVFCVHDGNIFCVNRNKVVQADPTVIGRNHHVTLVTALGGEFVRNYSAEITFSNGSTVSAAYTTTTSASTANATKIIEELYNDIVAASLPTGYTVEKFNEVLVVKGPEAMTATVDDGDAGTVLRVMTDVVDDQTDLPQYAPHGTIVKVVGDTADEDDYWLRFAAAGATVDGTSFGTEGIWEEWYKPGEVRLFDLTTMPHVLDNSSGFRLKTGDWKGRRVGSEESAPLPSFVGNAIRDMYPFDNRLTVVAGSAWVTSGTQEPFDFFRKSATVLIDSDPIDIQSTYASIQRLDWIVPFDRGLVILSDPGKAQFFINGGGLTPANATMELTTAYEMYGLTKPVNSGRTIMFPFKSGNYAGLQEFFPSDNALNNNADNITNIQPKYIVGDVTNIQSSTNFNTTLVTSTGEPDTIAVYKYLWDERQRLQSSWSKWTFDNNVRYMFFDNNDIFIVGSTDEETTLVKLDINREDDPVLEYHLCLDNKSVHTIVNNAVVLPYQNAVCVQQEGCPDIGSIAKPTLVIERDTGFHYYFDEDLKDGMKIVTGTRYKRVLQPTSPYLLDRSGQPITSAEIMIDKYLVTVEDTGDLVFTMQSKFRGDRVFTSSPYPLDGEPLDKNRTMLRSGDIEVPWEERADFSTLVISTDDIRPFNLIELKWRGNITNLRRRQL